MEKNQLGLNLFLPVYMLLYVIFYASLMEKLSKKQIS